MSGAAPSAWRLSLPETASRRVPRIRPRTRAASRNDWRSQPSNPHDGSKSTSRCNPGRAEVGTGNRSIPGAGPFGSGMAPTGWMVSRAERIGTRARSAAPRSSSGPAGLDALVRWDARAARKTENRCRRSWRRPRGCGVDVDEAEWAAMADSVARTAEALLTSERADAVLCIKRNAIGRIPREPLRFIRRLSTAIAHRSPGVVAARLLPASVYPFPPLAARGTSPAAFDPRGSPQDLRRLLDQRGHTPPARCLSASCNGRARHSSRQVLVRRWTVTTDCWQVECLVEDQCTPIHHSVLGLDRRHPGSRHRTRHRPAAGGAGQPQDRAGAGSQPGRGLDQRPTSRQVHQRDVETGPQPQPPEPGQLPPYPADSSPTVRCATLP